MTHRVFTALLPLLAPLLAVSAAAGEPAPGEVVDTLRKKLEVPSAGLTVGTVEASEMPGMYAVQFKEGPLVYATADGEYFIVGDLFTVGPAGYVNLAEKRRDTQRTEQLEGLATADMIVFPAQDKRRTHITVFTDVTCFYCQKLHREVPELNKHGVEVRYVAYPRAGLGTEGYRKLATAWCAEDRPTTLTRLKSGEAVPESVCKDNPIASQYELGKNMGVRGTPAIITSSGQMIPGYQSAEELMRTLDLE
ncbi:DsbC family protein [Kineobactrum salinum]|uniref:Thiol:disulfide interchange protein n=1 Tax=Kineobactrum salinum TaxID=2708301 RepID=A0A6C0U422_9GAMM|nr:DsbC family protein [Kineobactrum salinum]QIB66861.1 DsbC family protein [Kineobactrum salinum]